MPQFSQSTFLGCSVRSISSTLGWNGDSSRLVVSLVEDSSNGDSFVPVTIGQPIYFQIGSYKFYGLLKKWVKDNEFSGLPTYTVECGDPRSLLAQTQVITDIYNGSTAGIPNLINAYGFLESIAPPATPLNPDTSGFGNAQVNETGMPWRNLRNAIIALTNLPSYNDYGGPITYKGYTYSLDFSELPELPLYFRIGGPKVSILDFINQVCEYGGCDYFVELQGFKIKVRTASRANQPPLGTITAIADTNTGNVVKSSSGLEERDEVTTTFLIGGAVQILYKSTSLETFWGYGTLGTPIIGRNIYINIFGATGNYLGKIRGQEAGLNASPVADILGSTVYVCNTYEMRAALIGQNTWWEYVSKFRPSIAQMLNIPSLGNALPRSQVSLPTDRAQADLVRISNLNTIASGESVVLNKIKRMYDFVKFYATNYMGRKFACRLPFVLHKTDEETLQVSFSYQPTDAGFTSTESFFVNGIEYDLEDDLDNLPTVYRDLFQSMDGRYVPFVYYNNTARADFSKIDVNSTIIDGLKLYAKSHVDEKIIFIPEPAAIVTVNVLNELPQNLFGGLLLDNLVYNGARLETNHNNAPPNNSVRINGIDYPRVIPIRVLGGDVDQTYGKFNDRRSVLSYAGSGANHVWIGSVTGKEQTAITCTLRYYMNADNTETFGLSVTNLAGTNISLQDMLPAVGRTLSLNPLGASYYSRDTTEVDANGRARFYIGAFADVPHRNTASAPVMPNMAPPPMAFTSAHIPLKSNVLTYGPWYAGTTAGKVNVEVDSSLTPWNYGGYTQMDLAANAKVTSAITDMTVSEAGQLELAGAPTHSLGDIMQTGGPNITRININYSDRGVTTSYSFETFIPRFGHIGKYVADKIQRNAQITNHLTRETNQKFRQALVRRSVNESAARGATANYLDDYARLFQRQSPHSVLFFQQRRDVDYIRSSISTAKLEEALAGCNADNGSEFCQGGIVGLEALVRPVSIHGSGTYMANLEMPTGVWANSPLSSYNLNPLFKYTDVDYDILSYGDREYQGVNYYRDQIGLSGIRTNFIGLRGPLIISGFGYDISGNFVPNNNPYLLSDQWKTGPVDLLWREPRKTWTCHDGLKGKITQAVTARTDSLMGSGIMEIYKDLTTTRERLTVYNCFGTAVATGVWVQAQFMADDNKFYLSGADCS